MRSTVGENGRQGGDSSAGWRYIGKLFSRSLGVVVYTLGKQLHSPSIFKNAALYGYQPWYLTACGAFEHLLVPSAPDHGGDIPLCIIVFHLTSLLRFSKAVSDSSGGRKSYVMEQSPSAIVSPGFRKSRSVNPTIAPTIGKVSAILDTTTRHQGGCNPLYFCPV